MKLSQYFLPTLKENPIDATIKSHQLMIRAGMIRQTSSGIYTWLPLGLKVLRKVENIIREEMNKSGALEVLMPTIQPAELWKESGRYDAYGKEMLRIKDRHDRDILYGPTHEEVITDIFRKNITSYKDLPKNFYQIHWKFRDEIRPRFGLMRGREFLMKDSYSFDLDKISAKKTYNLMYETYFKIFRKMGLKAMALRADTGAIGGDLSHEFHILADTGESAIFYDKQIEEVLESKEFDLTKLQSLYAMADELHDETKCPVRKEDLKSRRGIEVGHIFNFGLKYSKALEASVMGASSPSGGTSHCEAERSMARKLDHCEAERSMAMGVNNKIYPNMGSYGIGVSRVVAAAIEANHDEKGIIWTKALAPFDIALVNVKQGDEICDKFCEEIYNKLREKNIDVIFDDTKAGLGQKLAVMDLIGIPTQVIVGPKSAAAGMVEIKDRKSGEKKEVRLEELFNLTLLT